MSEHTPGPWRVTGGGRDMLTVSHHPGDGLGSHIARLADAWLCDEHGGSIDANARLIAAAPDLLDALTALTRRVQLANAEGDPIASALIPDCLAAIAKATGEQS